MSTASSTARLRGSTADPLPAWIHEFEHVLALPEPATGVWHRTGVTPRGERIINVLGGVVLMLFALGWTWSIVHARAVAPEGSAITSATSTITSALTNSDAPSAAYLSDAALSAFTDQLLKTERGASGKLRATITPDSAPINPDTLPPGAKLRYARGGEVVEAPKGAGIWKVVLAVGNAIKPVTDFNVIEMLPFTAKKAGHVGLYFLGTWPAEKGKAGPKKAPSAAYANPSGFIEVTPENKDTYVTEHFKLSDFLTHDQPNTWPKYLVLQPKLLDKLELVLSDLQAHGVDTHKVTVLSGFRTPQYNAGGGTTSGRANLSRHMYGDASDIFIDANGDGRMDDLNHDGKSTIADSRVILAAVDRVEAAHPELVGGAGVYTAAAGHGPFIHIDTRGYRARWSGTSGG